MTHETFSEALGPDAMAALRGRAVARRFARGAALFHAGQVPDRVLLVTRGRVKLCRPTEDGREVMLAMRGPGDVIGEQSAIDGEPRSASAVALEQVEALALTPADFMDVVTRTPAAALFLMRELSRRLRDADRKRVELASGATLGRVAARLVELCESAAPPGDGGGLDLDVPLTQEDLAGWTGCSREAVSRALGQLRGMGLVSTGRRQLVVLDLPGLRRHAAG